MSRKNRNTAAVNTAAAAAVATMPAPAAPAAAPVAPPAPPVNQDARAAANAAAAQVAADARAAAEYVGGLIATAQGKGKDARIARNILSLVGMLRKAAASDVRKDLKPAQRTNTALIRQDAAAIVGAELPEVLRKAALVNTAIDNADKARGATIKGGLNAGQVSDAATGIIDGKGALVAQVAAVFA